MSDGCVCGGVEGVDRSTRLCFPIVDRSLDSFLLSVCLSVCHLVFVLLLCCVSPPAGRYLYLNG